MSGSGWSCTPSTLTCTRSDALDAGASYHLITLTVNVANSAPARVINSVTVSGGGEVNVANNAAADPTQIDAVDLAIAKSHVGSFARGAPGTYTIIVSNVGTAPSTSDPVTVRDVLPTGLSATVLTGSGWSCDIGALSCSRADPLSSGGSYPAITLAVNVATTAPASVMNSATVMGGGEPAGYTGNNSTVDVTTINPFGSSVSPVAARSTKVHGAAGTFGLPLSLVPTNPTTEPRSGPTHTIVFIYDRAIASANVSITEGIATAGSPMISGATVTVGLTGVANAQYVTVSVDTVTAADGTFGAGGAVRIGFLRGDVNGDRAVNLTDVGLVSSALALVTTAANFMRDVNASGALTLTDLAITSGALTTALPLP